MKKINKIELTKFETKIVQQKSKFMKKIHDKIMNVDL